MALSLSNSIFCSEKDSLSSFQLQCSQLIRSFCEESTNPVGLAAFMVGGAIAPFARFKSFGLLGKCFGVGKVTQVSSLAVACSIEGYAFSLTPKLLRGESLESNTPELAHSIATIAVLKSVCFLIPGSPILMQLAQSSSLVGLNQAFACFGFIENNSQGFFADLICAQITTTQNLVSGQLLHHAVPMTTHLNAVCDIKYKSVSRTGNGVFDRFRNDFSGERSLVTEDGTVLKMKDIGHVQSVKDQYLFMEGEGESQSSPEEIAAPKRIEDFIIDQQGRLIRTPEKVYMALDESSLPLLATLPCPDPELLNFRYLAHPPTDRHTIVIEFRNNGTVSTYEDLVQFWKLSQFLYGTPDRTVELTQLSKEQPEIFKGYVRAFYDANPIVQRVVLDSSEPKPTFLRILYQEREYSLGDFQRAIPDLFQERWSLPQPNPDQYLYRAVRTGEWSEIIRSGVYFVSGGERFENQSLFQSNDSQVRDMSIEPGYARVILRIPLIEQYFAGGKEQGSDRIATASYYTRAEILTLTQEGREQWTPILVGTKNALSPKERRRILFGDIPQRIQREPSLVEFFRPEFLPLPWIDEIGEINLQNGYLRLKSVASIGSRLSLETFLDFVNRVPAEHRRELISLIDQYPEDIAHFFDVDQQTSSYERWLETIKVRGLTVAHRAIRLKRIHFEFFMNLLLLHREVSLSSILKEQDQYTQLERVALEVAKRSLPERVQREEPKTIRFLQIELLRTVLSIDDLGHKIDKAALFGVVLYFPEQFIEVYGESPNLSRIAANIRSVDIAHREIGFLWLLFHHPDYLRFLLPPYSRDTFYDRHPELDAIEKSLGQFDLSSLRYGSTRLGLLLDGAFSLEPDYLESKYQEWRELPEDQKGSRVEGGEFYEREIAYFILQKYLFNLPLSNAQQAAVTHKLEYYKNEFLRKQFPFGRTP